MATSASASASVGVPIKLFREAESHAVTVELKSGDVYRGTLEESEDTLSCLLKDVVHTAREGRVLRLESVYLRGSQIRFVVLPEVLKGAPLFQCVLRRRASRYLPPLARVPLMRPPRSTHTPAPAEKYAALQRQRQSPSPAGAGGGAAGGGAVAVAAAAGGAASCSPQRVREGWCCFLWVGCDIPLTPPPPPPPTHTHTQFPPYSAATK
jgi:small nuclear ribonucleoprotein D3